MMMAMKFVMLAIILGFFINQNYLKIKLVENAQEEMQKQIVLTAI